MNVSAVIYSLMLWSWATEAHLLVKRAVDCPQITDFSGRVKYRRKGQRAIFRCPKSFQRFGSRAANCQPDGTWDTESPLCVKDGCIPLDASQVYSLDMDVKRGVITFKCLESYVLVGDSLIYCDGQTWSGPLPRCAAPHELTECDFEVDLCGWTQEDTDDVDWIRNSGITPTGDTGPKHDHTYNTQTSGHYMYFETSTPTETGNTAALKSPSYPEHLSPICFDFWYHMEGPDVVGHVGDLEVYVVDESEFIDDEDVQPIFTQSGNQGSEWKRGEIKIEQQDESFQIVFVATKRNSYISDIAIDDVRLFNCTDNSTIGVTKASSSLSTSTVAVDHTSPKHSIVPESTVISVGETTEQPTTVELTSKRITSVPTKPTHAQPTAVITTSLPVTPAPSTDAPYTTRKQTPKVTSTTTIKLTTPTTQTTTTSPTVRPTTTVVQTTTESPTTEVTTRSTRHTTALPMTSVTKSSTLSSTTTFPVPTTTDSPVQTTTASNIYTTAASATRISTSQVTSSYTTTSTPSSKTTASIASSTTTSRATSTRKTSTASSPKVQSTSKSTLTPPKETPTPKATKRSNSLTTKAPTGNTTKDNAISVVEQRSKHPEDDTLKPLMIGLGVGIVAGLIIIGVIAYVCVRRKKFYTSRYEDELKPITNAASVQSLNDDHFYKDEEYESES